jgi:hypothetical protein
MSPEILTQAVRLTSGLTELSLVSSIWIVSLPAYLERTPQGAASRQTLVTALYAISEPIYTWLLLRITLAPPILVLGTSIIHLTTSISARCEQGQLIYTDVAFCIRLCILHDITHGRLLNGRCHPTSNVPGAERARSRHLETDPTSDFLSRGEDYGASRTWDGAFGHVREGCGD